VSRKKGWAVRYDKMSRDEVRAEFRRLERANYVHDRQDKTRYLSGVHPVYVTTSQAQLLSSSGMTIGR
jgi:hypothetical protein